MSEERCRLVMLLHPDAADAATVSSLAACTALYCVVFYPAGSTEERFAGFCEQFAPLFADNSIPLLITDNSRVMGRCGADGLFVERERPGLRDILDRHGHERIIGAGAIKNRHMAMEIGEMGPDFIFFGKTGGDIKPQAHPKNMELARWWSEIFEIPCVLMAGNDFGSILECAKTGADFVAVERAILNHEKSPAEALAEADALLEKHAPRFEEVDA